MKIRAFNLVPGAVFEYPALFGADPAVAIEVDRDCDREEVEVRIRFGYGRDELTLDFCELVEVVGLCVNPDDDDDVDFGGFEIR